jgi:hypothetical protein
VLVVGQRPIEVEDQGTGRTHEANARAWGAG